MELTLEPDLEHVEEGQMVPFLEVKLGPLVEDRLDLSCPGWMARE
jgi:hypothetical protein